MVFELKIVSCSVFNFGLLYFTVSKWRGEAGVDDFDRSNVSSQSGLDDLSYPGDPRRFMEVVGTLYLKK